MTYFLGKQLFVLVMVLKDLSAVLNQYEDISSYCWTPLSYTRKSQIIIKHIGCFIYLNMCLS